MNKKKPFKKIKKKKKKNLKKKKKKTFLKKNIKYSIHNLFVPFSY